MKGNVFALWVAVSILAAGCLEPGFKATVGTQGADADARSDGRAGDATVEVPDVLPDRAADPDTRSPDAGDADAADTPDAGGGESPPDLLQEDAGEGIDSADALPDADALDLPPDADLVDTAPDEQTPEDTACASVECGDGKCEVDCGETKESCKADCCECGDGSCDNECGETEWNCKNDCCDCGDGECVNVAGCDETKATCPGDCSVWGDGECTGDENPLVYPEDCCPGNCGDGKCLGEVCNEGVKGCPKDCVGFACGNKICEPGEDPISCLEDCKHHACGNGICEDQEDFEACSLDCTANCGDCKCDQGESNAACPIDCGFCGDGYCSTCLFQGEGLKTCPQDCCNDWNPCTSDTWGEENGGTVCKHAPDDAADCEAQLVCTTGDFCQDGKCKAGPGLVDCDDSDPCTADKCDPAKGGCLSEFNADPCDDGNPCTLTDLCVLGACVGSGDNGCDDGNACTIDMCISQDNVGCMYQKKPDTTQCTKTCELPKTAQCLNGECSCV